MTVVTTLMYAVAMVAMLALILECCCRRQLKRLRASAPSRQDVDDGGLQVTLRNVQINIPYVVATSQSGAAYYPAPAPTPAVYYPPPPVALATGAVPAFGFNPHLESPPPTYEQVMAADRLAPGPQQPG